MIALHYTGRRRAQKFQEEPNFFDKRAIVHLDGRESVLIKTRVRREDMSERAVIQGRLAPGLTELRATRQE